ncbi:protein phosphatase [Exophiala viscosa]|uniref:protein phosphatase n=1 Tax=Exophiala viscosa TaxID=2486360 RepID=UPI002192EBDE|nr:protein phosphatase [Exophiala viscosa]
MPYTPPSQLSPSSSKQSSPTPSRSHSYIKGQFLSPQPPAPSGRPNLPRSNGSSSYLTKHRRSPSLNDAQTEILHNGEAYQENRALDPYGSIRQSPPPASNSLIPAGMTISPPESSHNSSDDEDLHTRGRSRDIELGNLEALQAAIRSIEQRKGGSPTRRQGNNETTTIKMDLAAPQLDGPVQTETLQLRRPPLSQEARKISHSRSSTDSSIVFESPKTQMAPVITRQDTDDSDSDSQGPPTDRPPMVRKKSGELVRPALRASSRRRPSSMPGTPTYSKAVHFDSHLEHVRHFLQVDRPLAVSAGSSPVENYESDSEFPFGSDEASARPRTTSPEWELRLTNFAADIEARKNQVVSVERVFLSSDNKNLIGSVAVQNLAFSKQVVARFTFDYWKTTSEVVADFNNDVRRGQSDGFDRFNFSIRLADQANLENKTLFFCIRYTVNGQEFWDNNAGFNYQVDFAKKTKVQHGKNGMPGLGARPITALPRTRQSPPTSSGRPKGLPTSFDDFSTGFESFGFGQSAGALMGEPKLKLRSPRSKTELMPDPPSRRKVSGGQAFGNRYDFNSSLTAAKNFAVAALGEHSGLTLRADAKQSSGDGPATTPTKSVTIAPPKQNAGVNGSVPEAVSPAPATAPMTSKPAALVSEKPSLSSREYADLVEKYCFVGAQHRGKSEEVKTH